MFLADVTLEEAAKNGRKERVQSPRRRQPSVYCIARDRHRLTWLNGRGSCWFFQFIGCSLAHTRRTCDRADLRTYH